MTVIAVLIGWWAFLVVMAIALCRARDRKPAPRTVRVETVDLRDIEWNWIRT